MKSLLVDALRAANDGNSDLELEDDVSAKTVSLSESRGTVTAPVPEESSSVDELELLDSSDTEEGDARFSDEPSRVEPVQPDTAPRPKPEYNKSGIERLSGWAPPACVMLVLLAAILVSSWTTAKSERNNRDLGILSAQNPESGSADAPGLAGSPAPRFALIKRSSQIPPVVVPDAGSAGPATNTVQVQDKIVKVSRPARSAVGAVGVAELAHDTFSSLGAVYQSFLSGQISGAALTEILAARMADNPGLAEEEIKLLLQRYPDSSRLYQALGDVLLQSDRWPEAQVAFANAEKLSGQSAQGDRL